VKNVLYTVSTRNIVLQFVCGMCPVNIEIWLQTVSVIVWC